MTEFELDFSVHGKNDFAVGSKILMDTDVTIILLSIKIGPSK